MAKNYEIRLSGSGGQGLILAGIILAEQPCTITPHHQTQSYGPESRGGYSRADVIISDARSTFRKPLPLTACFLSLRKLATSISLISRNKAS
jgi:2-oxoglutarate ferredoxin oxidoreductase subunit gamma